MGELNVLSIAMATNVPKYAPKPKDREKGSRGAFKFANWRGNNRFVKRFLVKALKIASEAGRLNLKHYETELARLDEMIDKAGNQRQQSYFKKVKARFVKELIRIPIIGFNVS